MWAPPRMSDLINEMNGALQLEKGQNIEKGGMNIEIPQYASQSKTCASLEETTVEEIKSLSIFDEKSTSDCDPKGKRQQPQTSTTRSHWSRSVFQIVSIYHLIMQEMTRGLIVNNLCCGTL